jgi:photosystem II stability/assembly factor-like uncharacterized protein
MYRLKRISMINPKMIKVGAILFAAACASTRDRATHTFTVTHSQAPAPISMRGLSVVNENVVWASGTSGSVIRTTDGGATWQLHKIANADSLDFRDIEAIDANRAYVLSAGEDGRIYYTSDGGATWTLQFRNTAKDAFFDCLDFFDDNRTGIAMSDPLGGRYLLVKTTNGQAWSELPAVSRPQAEQGEAAFAASGTCLTIAGNRAYLATGGGPAARVYWSDDRGYAWHATSTPVPAGAQAAGIFALAFRDAHNGIAIGGDYTKPQQAATVAVTNDGGRTWRAAGATSYTSGAAWSRSGASLIAVGTPGTRLSHDAGLTWVALDSLEYNAVQFAGENVAYAVGPRGRIAKLWRR